MNLPITPGLEHRRRAKLLRLWLLFALLLSGCGGQPSYDHVYTLRGRVVGLPGGSAVDEFVLHHEEVPDYVSINGSIGMHAMAMGLNVPDPSVLDGIAVGDVVEVVYGESFEPKIRTGVISVKKLPADTVLEFEQPSEPPAGTGQGDVLIEPDQPPAE